MSEISPIILFACNRPCHTKKTIDALIENSEHKLSDFYIFLDIPKSIDSLGDYAKVKEIIYSYVNSSFKSVSIIERSRNFGLAENILDGVGRVIDKHGKAIVLEDDIVVSNVFLKFMNDALNKYENNEKIWHISGWNYPVNFEGDASECFFWGTMNCWGWGTWKSRWVSFQKEPDNLVKNWSRKKIKKFNLDGVENFWSQVVNNHNEKINTWAVFWYATIFENKGLCLNPKISLVENIGLDGSGTHCNDEDIYKGEVGKKSPLLPDEVFVDERCVSLIKDFYRSNQYPLWKKVVNKIKQVFI